MRSVTTSRFRSTFAELPPTIQQRARRAYRLFQQNPNHPGLGFKQVHPFKPIYSVRIGLGDRAIGIRDNDILIWFWIGSHADYDRMLSQV